MLVDLAADLREIDEGAFSNGITPRGKGGPLAPMDARQGINSYSSWFANDHDMSGDYFGYDGPCPPGTIRSCTATSSRYTRWTCTA